MKENRLTLKIGHRGARGYEPENTLLSFEKAIELNVDMVELDVHLCKTGEVIVIHDDTVNRTTNGSGPVKDMTLQELKALEADKREKIPTLQEVLDLVDRKAKVNIELKDEGIAKPLLDILEKYVNEKGWTYEDFLVSSFNYHELEACKNLRPGIKIGLLLRGRAGYAKLARRYKAYSVHISKEFTNKLLIDDAHKRGLKLFVWTVNDIDDIKRMISLRVDGIFSDFPDRL